MKIDYLENYTGSTWAITNDCKAEMRALSSFIAGSCSIKSRKISPLAFSTAFIPLQKGSLLVKVTLQL